MNTNALTIGQIARRANVGVETIRFYERKGLIADPPRRASGYRQYPPDTVDRIRFIRHAKELGFTLREIKELLELRVDPRCHCDQVLELAAAKITDIEGKIAQLQRIKRVLSELAMNCQHRRPTARCPILAAMDDEA